MQYCEFFGEYKGLKVRISLPLTMNLSLVSPPHLLKCNTESLDYQFKSATQNKKHNQHIYQCHKP